VLSPLLANIALHGLEAAVRTGRAGNSKAYGYQPAPYPVRYADDFVIIHANLAVLQETRAIVTEWLQGIGLELHPTKTRIAHTLAPHDGTPAGFDFLGFHVRHFPVGRTHQPKTAQGQRLAHKVIIRPSDGALKRHHTVLSATIARLQAATQESLIRSLAPQVVGWARYYRTVASSRWLAKADYRLHQRLRRWCRRRHPHKSTAWQQRRYWVQGWIFGSRHSPLRLPLHTATAIQRHVKVQGRRSPYDGDWVYWSQRLGRPPELPKRVATLLQRQRGRCQRCGLRFTTADVLEVDHVVPRSQGGKDAYSNWQLLHGHCHDQRHAMTMHRVAEEPDEAKVSRPVLEAGGGRRLPSPS
jgi:RNA-directed DNA polymerase